MKIIFDEKEYIVSPFAHNIAAFAKENNITIPTPCQDNGHNCCHVCLIEINGEAKYACKTRPAEGMVIVYDRADLKEKRKESMKKYKEKLQKGIIKDCGCVKNS